MGYDTADKGCWADCGLRKTPYSLLSGDFEIGCSGFNLIVDGPLYSGLLWLAYPSK